MTLFDSPAALRASTARFGRLVAAFVLAASTAGCKDKEEAPSSPKYQPHHDAGRVPRQPATSGEASDPDEVPVEELCAEGLLRCGGNCIDPATSIQHCGACNHPCSTGTQCLQRRCVRLCQPNTTHCGTDCFNLSSDVRNCGACGVACFPDQVCSDGHCTCAKEKTACAGVCVEPQLGLCGVCGKDCPEDAPCADGAAHDSDWPTLGGDMSRTGYNQGERGTPPLSEGWAVSVTADPLNPVLVSGARVFVSGQTPYGRQGPLLALDLDTGETLWKYDFGAVSMVGQATLANCRAYVQSSTGGSSPTSSRVWAIRADTGEAVWSRVVPQQWNNAWSPAVTAEGVYLNAPTGGLSGFARKTGVQLFRSTEPTQASGPWVVAVSGPDLYTFVTGKLRRHDAKNGNVLDTISVKWSSSVNTPVSTPVLSAEGVVYLAAPPTLYAFEAISKRLLWSYAANVSGTPALAEGRVLTFDSQLLTSLDANTGAMQWRNLDVEGLVQAPVVAAGYAYAASKTTTYALDLRDGSVAWSAKVSGALSVGGGRLFVAGSDGILHSYVLTQPPPASSPQARVR
jgi:outer membrane protein assembly factor BamB